MTNLSPICEAINKAHRLLLVGHVDPDPDCVGSMLAMHWLCQKLGKTSLPLSDDPMLPQWSFFPLIEHVQKPDVSQLKDQSWDTLVVVDCEIDRAGSAAQLRHVVHQIINIDHHQTNAGDVGVGLVNPKAAATGELIYDLIRAFDVPMDRDVATLLYVAIMSDTGSFRFSNTTAKVLRVAADLVAYGASPSDISGKIYDRRSWAYVRLLGLVLSTLTRSENGRVAWTCLTRDMIASVGARDDESEGFVQYPRMIDGVEVAIFFRELETGEIKASLRSKETVDVSQLAAEFGGGGHIRAAGCTLNGPLDAAIQKLTARAIEMTRVVHK